MAPHLICKSIRAFVSFLILSSALVVSAETSQVGDSVQGAHMLKEVVVKTRKQQVLHILAYVRDYSTLTSYSDTIKLYREKWVDFMLPTSPTKKFEGWRAPRILKAKSYYRFTNAFGLDSVSDNCNQHFSWSDWVGIIDDMDIPKTLLDSEYATDTIHGKYSPTEIWTRTGDDVCLNVNVLADTSSRRWVPDFSVFFGGKTDFEKFKIRYDFHDVYKKAFALDLTSISCDIESRGRGRDMFMFNRRDEPFFVSTQADFYIVDKEFITVSEAKKWRKQNVIDADWTFAPPTDIVPALSAETSDLIARVEAIDHDALRLGWKPDPKIVATRRPIVPLHKRYFKFLKSLIGL